MKQLINIICITFFVFQVGFSATDTDSVLIEYENLTTSQAKIDFLETAMVSKVYANADAMKHYAHLYDSLAYIIGGEEYKAKAFTHTGMAHYVAEEYDIATEFYLKALRIVEKTDNESYKAKIYNNLAACYNFRSNFENTNKYFNKALDIYTKNNDTLWIANLNNNLATLYMDHKKYDAAQKYFDQAIVAFKLLENSLMLGITHLNYGNLKIFTADYKNAIPNYERSLKLVPKNQVPLVHAIANSGIGIAHTQLQAYDKAFPHLKKGVKISTEINHLQQLAESYTALSDYYKATNNYKQAFELAEKVQVLKDSIHNSTQDQNMTEALTKYESEKKDQEISLLNAENQVKQLELQKAKRQRTFYLLSLLGLFSIALLFLGLFRTRQKANRLLTEKNLQIEKALGEKEILLKEIHHRVKNNLQVISSLLSLQSRQIEDPKALMAIEEGRNRVKSMALIHQNLYQDEDLVGVDLKAYIKKLSKSLLRNYKVDEHKVSIETDVDEIKLDIDSIIPIGLVLNELISNSLKYAFENIESGKINISCKEENQQLNLKVSDNGIGLPNTFSIENSKSLGFKLIKAFSEKLKAKLQISSVNGTEVEMQINNYKVI